MSFLPITEMLNLIDKPNRTNCIKLHNYILEYFPKTPGSSHNHQAWEGGYFDHVAEVMNWAMEYYDLHTDCGRALPFSLSDALLITFLHDAEKPWKHNSPEVKEALKVREAKEAFRMGVLKDFEIVLTPEQQNALKYVEGEIEDYSNEHRVMNELAAFCHICDVSSARIFHNYPHIDFRWSK